MKKNPMPPYRILSFTTSKEDDNSQWFTLEIKLHASRFRISVSPSNFHNSVIRSDEFQKYFALLLSEKDDPNDSVEESAQEEDEGNPPGDTSLDDCFDWAIIPCLDQFERLSPAPPPLKNGEQLSLSHFLAVNLFECDLTAVDDVLAPGEIEPIDDYTDENFWPSPRPAPGPTDAWTTSFPSFSPTEITVICDDPAHPFDSNPSQVRVGQQRLFFKEGFDLDDMVMKKEVETYEKIAVANFGPDVRTARLYGVVQNDKNQLVGLLLCHIEEDAPLTFAVGPDTLSASKDRWARQIRDTMAALHGVGIVWGDAKPDNILIDVHGDAWLIDFGGGRTEGWVDSDKAGTVDGDLQGLERILNFIYE
jgi:hypothetical protein